MSDEFIGQQFTWFTGIVEDVQDPEYMNRVKVRCLGFYDAEVSVDDLPWATVMMPCDTASMQGNSTNHQLEIGSWVVGFFRDGPSAQDPLVMGSIASQTAGVRDAPLEHNGDYDDKYIKTKAGHRIRFNNSDGREKVEIFHGTNNSRISMDEYGGVDIQSNSQIIRLRDKLGLDGQNYISIEPSATSPVYIQTTGADINLSATGGGRIKMNAGTLSMNNAKRAPGLAIPRSNSNPSQDDIDVGALVGNFEVDQYVPDQDTKDAIIEYLGGDYGITDSDYNYLIRTAASEASPNAKERASVVGVVLNRVRNNYGGNTTITGVVTQVYTKNGNYIPQFSGVMGTKYNRGPTGPFRNMTVATGDEVSSAIKANLSGVNKSWQNFSAVRDDAYLKPGEQNIAFRDSLRDAGGQVVGLTIFGTV